MATTFTSHFVHEKATPGTHRFKEVVSADDVTPAENGDARIGTLYVRKTAFNGSGTPKRLTVTVSSD